VRHHGRGREKPSGDSDLLAVAPTVMRHGSTLDLSPAHDDDRAAATQMFDPVSKSFSGRHAIGHAEQFGAAFCSISRAAKPTSFTSAGVAKIAGLKINEYGVFRLDDENHELAGAK